MLIAFASRNGSIPILNNREMALGASFVCKVEKVKCMDMFPNTPHVETVVKLVKVR